MQCNHPRHTPPSPRPKHHATIDLYGDLSQVLIYAVLLICWSTNLNGNIGAAYLWVEHFAGMGNATKTATWANLMAASLDIVQGQSFAAAESAGAKNPFDIMSPSGLAFCG